MVTLDSAHVDSFKCITLTLRASLAHLILIKQPISTPQTLYNQREILKRETPPPRLELVKPAASVVGFLAPCLKT